MSIPEGMSANMVLENYIEAIGGKAKLEAVESYAMIAEAEMQGTTLELEMKNVPRPIHARHKSTGQLHAKTSFGTFFFISSSKVVPCISASAIMA